MCFFSQLLTFKNEQGALNPKGWIRTCCEQNPCPLGKLIDISFESSRKQPIRRKTKKVMRAGGIQDTDLLKELDITIGVGRSKMQKESWQAGQLGSF